MVIEGQAETIKIEQPEDPDWFIDEMHNPNVYQPDWLDEVSDERLVLDSVCIPFGGGNDSGSS